MRLARLTEAGAGGAAHHEPQLDLAPEDLTWHLMDLTLHRIWTASGRDYGEFDRLELWVVLRRHEG